MCGKISLKYLWIAMLVIIGFWLFPSMEVRAETYTIDGTTYDTDDAKILCYNVSSGKGLAFWFDNAKVLVVRALDNGETPDYVHNYDFPWYGLDINTIYFTEDVTYISDDSFTSSSVKRVILPNTVEKIGSCAFEKCSKLEYINLPDSITYIGTSAFAACANLCIEADMPDSLETIEGSAFYGCSKMCGTLSLPDSLSRIEQGAFYNCKGLTGNLIIPDSVTTLEDYAFSGCTGLTGKLKLSSNITSIDYGVFNECSGLTGTLDLPSGITGINKNAFAECSGFTGQLVIPPNVKGIGDSAFRQCSGFTGDLEIPSSVMEIGANAFYQCYGFDGQLILSEGLYLIDGEAFRECTGFTGELVIPESVIGIVDRAFYGCSSIEALHLKMTSPYAYINTEAFADMPKLSKIKGNGLDYVSTSVSAFVPDAHIFRLFDLDCVKTEVEDFPTWTTWKEDLWHERRYPVTVTLSAIIDSETTTVSTQYTFSGDRNIYLDISKLPKLSGKKPSGSYYYYRDGEKISWNISSALRYDFVSYCIADNWEKNIFTEYYDAFCTVIFREGSSVNGKFTSYGEVTIPYNTCVEPIESPVKDNKKFLYWYKSDFTEFDFSTPITEDIQLIARWGNYKYYNLNFYTGEEWDSYEGKLEGTLTFREDEYPTPLDVKPRIGYCLSDWYEIEIPGDIHTRLYNFNEYLLWDTYAYAQWEECSHTVSFNTNTVTEIPSQTVLCNDVCVKPTENLEKEGHTLLGWYTDTGELYDFNTPVTEDMTLTALWSVNKHTVTFSDNLTGYAYLKSVDWGTTVIAPEPPVRNGYNLIGWYTDETGTEPFDFDAPITQDITVYAKWEKDASMHTVLYVSSDGSILDTLSVASGTVLTAPSVPEKDGHTFKGWFSNDVLYDFSQPVTSNLILMQKWDSVLHTVSFNSEGGSIIPNQTLIYGGVAVEPVSPTKEGYDFKGWYLGTTLYDFNNPVKQDIALTAKWEKIKTYYNVVIIKDVNVDSESFSIEEGYTVPTQETPTKEGYEFKGWFVNNNPYNFNDPVTSNLVIVARWEKVKVNYTVDFVVDEQTKESVVVEEGTTVKPPAEPTKDKHIFKGWFLGDSKYDFGVPVYSDMTLIARWEKIKENYTVNFVVDGEVTSTVSVEEGSTVSEPTEPTKDKHTFKGWFLGSTKYDFSTPVTQNITLTAQWEKLQEKCTVKFVSDNKVLSTVTVEKNNTVKEPKEPTKTGYTFKGWFLSNAKYNFSTPVTSDLTLTAKWEKEDVYHKVYFSDGTGTNIVNVKSGDKVSEPSQPAKAGYNFQGWCGDAAGKTDNYNFDKEVTSDLWLYAKWEEASKPTNVTPEPEPKPSKPEPEPESKTPSKPEPKPKESKPQESKEPDPKPDTSSKIKEVVPELDEEVITPIEPEIEVESTTEEATVVEDDDVSEIEAEHSNTIAPISTAPVGTDKTENNRDWLWLILLIFLLLPLPLLFLFLLLAVRRVKVFAEVITDSEDEVDFQQIYKTFIKTKDDAYHINIPSRATQDCFSDTFKVLLTEYFVKKHAGEELYVNIDVNEEHFSNLFVLEEGVVELLFNISDNADTVTSLTPTEELTGIQENPPFSN